MAAALATNSGMFRLTIRALQRRQLMPKVFVPAATLPARALLQLQSHLTLQDSVKRIVGASVCHGGSAASGTSTFVMSERLASVDMYVADLIDGGLKCHFTPCEAMFGILSIGNIAALVATHQYVPRVAPAVAALTRAAKLLNFGPRNAARIDYRSTYSPFIAALSEVDKHDLVFDIKEIITLFVDALNRTGPRAVIAWDDNLLASLRLKN